MGLEVIAFAMMVNFSGWIWVLEAKPHGRKVFFHWNNGIFGCLAVRVIVGFSKI